MGEEKLPSVTAIMAISVDGKISEGAYTPARFSSEADLRHLERQIALCDAVMFGANTLRAYETSIVIREPKLLKEREERQQSPQPLHVVCSISGELQPHWRFFSQPLPRGLITTPQGLQNWQRRETGDRGGFFQEFFVVEYPFDWVELMARFYSLGYKKIGVLGGANLFSSLLKLGLIEDLWLTICPLLIGKTSALSIVSASQLTDFPLPISLKLVEVEVVGEELFVHYKLKRRR
ncbi:MAG: RibD family protein [Geminocystis sp.]|nr:RibD family protein [Geminocystis sp.]MCS7148074.1 RibD family protein [Geminocystis sp.]MDW8116426.1 RibD family protein [Geminocystis sp.]MDW8462090.1 RibD family protein [Geminocystis sp.]HIK38293.1 RibD family protein [Geminocystis sp. M7585_C2015_104]